MFHLASSASSLSLSSFIWAILRARDLWAASLFFSRLRTVLHQQSLTIVCNVEVCHDAEAHARRNVRHARAHRRGVSAHYTV